GFFKGDHRSSHSLQDFLPGGIAGVFNGRPAQRIGAVREWRSVERACGKLVPAGDMKHEFPNIMRLRSNSRQRVFGGHAVENVLQRRTVPCLSEAGTAELVG